MAYIGRPLNAGNLAVQSGTGDGSDTTPIATLNYATTTNGIAVYLDGVRQLAGTDYNVTAQTTLTFTTAPANGVGVDVYFLGLEVSIPTPADSSVSTAKIANNAVDETKLKDALIGDFTDVTVTASDTFLYGDATDSGNTKRDTVQGILDLAGGGAWTLIGTAVASSSASLTITGISSTYDTYACVYADIKVATDGAGPRIRLGDSSGIDTGGTDYYWCGEHVKSDSSTGSNGNAGTDEIRAGDVDCGSASGEGMGGRFFIYNPTDTTTNTILCGETIGVTNAGILQLYRFGGGRKAVIAIDRVQFYLNTGNIASGRFSVYGIAHA
jgi:hypothetical protein